MTFELILGMLCLYALYRTASTVRAVDRLQERVVRIVDILQRTNELHEIQNKGHDEGLRLIRLLHESDKGTKRQLTILAKAQELLEHLVEKHILEHQTPVLSSHAVSGLVYGHPQNVTHLDGDARAERYRQAYIDLAKQTGWSEETISEYLFKLDTLL